MEQYYIATEDGKTEGPYSFESLETFYTHGKIKIDTLVCIAGSQEWMEFKKVLEQERKVQSEKEQEQTEATPTDVELIPTVEGLFQIMGILALLAGVILALCNTGPGYAAIGIIYLLSAALPGICRFSENSEAGIPANLFPGGRKEARRRRRKLYKAQPCSDSNWSISWDR